jgi:hypothetical protein
MCYLEEWSLLDRNHSNSLSGATEALKASTLRLPVSGKAVVSASSPDRDMFVLSYFVSLSSEH